MNKMEIIKVPSPEGCCKDLTELSIWNALHSYYYYEKKCRVHNLKTEKYSNPNKGLRPEIFEKKREMQKRLRFGMKSPSRET